MLQMVTLRFICEISLFFLPLKPICIAWCLCQGYCFYPVAPLGGSTTLVVFAKILF